jgi:hypothetical protein
MNTGFGPFYDGLTHLFVTPEDLLPVIALSLLAGLRGPRFGRAVLFALPVAWLVGSAAGLLLAPHITLPVAEIIVTIALGALLAADFLLPVPFVASLASPIMACAVIATMGVRRPSGSSVRISRVASKPSKRRAVVSSRGASVRLWGRVDSPRQNRRRYGNLGFLLIGSWKAEVECFK